MNWWEQLTDETSTATLPPPSQSGNWWEQLSDETPQVGQTPPTMGMADSLRARSEVTAPTYSPTEWPTLSLEQQRDSLIADQAANPTADSGASIGRITELYSKRIRERDKYLRTLPAAIPQETLDKVASDISQLPEGPEKQRLYAEHAQAVADSADVRHTREVASQRGLTYAEQLGSQEPTQAFYENIGGSGYAGEVGKGAVMGLSDIGNAAGNLLLRSIGMGDRADAADQARQFTSKLMAADDKNPAGSFVRGLASTGAKIGFAGQVGIPVVPMFTAEIFDSTLAEDHARGMSATGSLAHAAGTAAINAGLMHLAGSIADKYGLFSREQMLSPEATGAAKALLTKIGLLDATKSILYQAGEGGAIQFSQSVFDYLTGVNPNLTPEQLAKETAKAAGEWAAFGILAAGAGKVLDAADTERVTEFRNSLQEYYKKLPTALRAAKDAESHDGDVPPTDRRGFSEATGKKHRSKEYREAYSAAVEANRAFQEDAAATGEQGAEPDLRGPRIETKPLTPEQLKQHNREVEALRQVDLESADALSKMPPQEAAAILAEAGTRANAENESLRNLQALYDEVVGRDGAKSARAAKAVAQGGDEEAVKRFDFIAERLRDPANAELASVANDIGILSLVAGGRKQFDPSHKAADYVPDILAEIADQQATQESPVATPLTQEELSNGQQEQTQQGESQTQAEAQGNAQGQENVLASEPQPGSQPVAKSQPVHTQERQQITDHVDSMLKQFSDYYGTQLVRSEPSNPTQEHYDAAEFAAKRGVLLIYYEQPESDVGNIHGVTFPGTKAVFIRNDASANSLWAVVGHELAHATGFDARSKGEEKLIEKYSKRYYDLAPPFIQEKLDANPKLRRAEGVASLTEELFANRSFRNEVRGKMPTFWGRIKRAIKQVLGSYTPKDRFAQEVLAEFGVKATATAETVGSPMASMTRREENNPRKLANIAQTPREREYLAILDQLATEAGEPGLQPDEQVQAEATDRLANNYERERQNIMRRGNAGEQLGSVETLIAKQMFQEEAFDALSSGDPQKLAQVSALRDAYRATGTSQARAFRLRQDPLNGKTVAEATPKQRQALLVDELFNRPGSESKQRQKAAEKGDQAKVNELDQKHAARLAKIEQQLAMLGLTLNDLPKIARDPTLTQKVRNQIQTTKATLFDKLFEFRTSLGLFSGPATQAANIAGNAFHGLYDYAIQAPTEAVLNEMMLRVGAGDIAGRRLGEFPYLWQGIRQGVVQGMRNAMQVMRTEMPVAKVDDKFDHSRAAIGGKFGKIVRGMGYTSLSAADEFFNTMFANIEVGGAAFRMGLLKGLSGQELSQFIGQQTTTPDSLSWRIALKHASDLTFHQELHGAAAKALGAAHAVRNVLGMRWFIPVISFPVKAGAVAARKAPVTGDVAMLLKAYDNWHSGKPVMTGMSRRFAERAIAWGATMAILATNDPDDPWITGQSTAPPGTPKGSIKIGGQWLSYSRIEPFSAILGMTVDGMNVARTGSSDKIVSGAADIPLKQIGSKTFLQGLSDVIDLAGLSKDSSDKVLDRTAQWGTRFGESWVPNFYRQLVGATRENRDQSKIWGTTTGEKLSMGGRRILKSAAPIQYDAKVDPWGRKMMKGEAPFWSAPATDFAWRLISPVYQTSQQPTIGDQIYARYNTLHGEDKPKEPSTVLPYITLTGQRYALSEAEYEEYQVLAGTLADQAAQRVSKLPGFNVEAPTEANMKLLEKAVDAAKDQARARLRPKWRKARQPQLSSR